MHRESEAQLLTAAERNHARRQWKSLKSGGVYSPLLDVIAITILLASYPAFAAALAPAPRTFLNTNRLLRGRSRVVR